MGNIIFCSNCGTKLEDGARFCSRCGNLVGTISTETPEINKKEVFEGEKHICPNCFNNIDSFEASCPYCGFEVRGAKTSDSVSELVKKLEMIDAKQMPKIETKKSILKSLIGTDFNEDKEKEELLRAKLQFEKEKEEEKVNLIINCAIPNTKEDILEFMIMASTIIKSKQTTEGIRNAWQTKMDQTYQKAELSIKKGSDFAQIKNIYDSTQKDIRDKKIKSMLMIVGLVGGWFVLMGLYMNPAVTITILISIVLIAIVIFLVLKKIDII